MIDSPFFERGDEMSISSTVKKVMPYLKTASGYVLHRLSSQAVEMDDGTTLEQKVTSLNNLISQKIDTSDVVNNVLTTEEGFVLDARQGKVMDDKITELNGKLNGVQVTPVWGSGTSATEWSCICKNNRVLLNAIIDKTQTIPANTRWKICTIPEGYRPETEVMCPIIRNSKAAIGTVLWASVLIDPDGSVYIISTADIDTSWYIRLSVAWDI